MDSSKIIVCGADWCHDTIATLGQLDQLGIEYTYIDIEQDPKAAEWVRAQNGGQEKKPTLDIDGIILTEPSEDDLVDALRSKGVLA